MRSDCDCVRRSRSSFSASRSLAVFAVASAVVTVPGLLTSPDWADTVVGRKSKQEKTSRRGLFTLISELHSKNDHCTASCISVSAGLVLVFQHRARDGDHRAGSGC